MAKIRNSNLKQSGGGYERLVDDKDMASIFTKAQSTAISNGTELEKIISNRSNTITDLDAFIDDCDNGTVADGSYLCIKVELKDGDAFDTKKSLAEKEMLELFVNHLAPKIPFRTKFYNCCFNQPDKHNIVSLQ